LEYQLITVQDFVEAVNYKITGGSNYQWTCFGHNARWLDSEHITTYTANIVFDTEDQTVYQADVCDYVNTRAYRWEHPNFKDAHQQEASSRSVENDEAWEGVKYTILETTEDFLQKCTAIASGKFDYDTKISVPLTLNDSEMLRLMTLAHEADVTLNQYVEQVLREMIDSKIEL
jgi:hypothetical protein